MIVLVPVIAPYAAARDAVRDDHDAAGVPFGEVFVSTSLEVAERRDVKGLYAKARRGEISGMTGIDDPYEQPAAPSWCWTPIRSIWTRRSRQSTHLLSTLLRRELR